MTNEKTLYDVLADDGLSLPTADDLDDEAVSTKLWEAIHALAARKIYLLSTNHLSDRQLYAKLLGDVLRDEYTPLPDWSTGCFFDVLDIEEDIVDYLKYYADDLEREGWAPDDLPGDFDELPAREPMPYDRDSRLPSGPLNRGTSGDAS